jgi:membrane-anchored glycerophosphoryl diester phosphodiesterase (GDPDase)
VHFFFFLLSSAGKNFFTYSKQRTINRTSHETPSCMHLMLLLLLLLLLIPLQVVANAAEAKNF